MIIVCYHTNQYKNIFSNLFTLYLVDIACYCICSNIKKDKFSFKLSFWKGFDKSFVKYKTIVGLSIIGQYL